MKANKNIDNIILMANWFDRTAGESFAEYTSPESTDEFVEFIKDLGGKFERTDFTGSFMDIVLCLDESSVDIVIKNIKELDFVNDEIIRWLDDDGYSCGITLAYLCSTDNQQEIDKFLDLDNGEEI